MDECPPTAYSREAKGLRGPEKCVPVVLVERDVDCELAMTRARGATNQHIAHAATMRRIDDQWPAHPDTQAFQSIKEFGIVPVFAAATAPPAFAGKLHRPEMRPAPVLPGNVSVRSNQHGRSITPLRTRSDSKPVEFLRPRDAGAIQGIVVIGVSDRAAPCRFLRQPAQEGRNWLHRALPAQPIFSAQRGLRRR
jgi:hypothetical protein